MSNEPIEYRDQKDNNNEAFFSSQSSPAATIYSSPSNTNIPVTASYSQNSLNASSTTTGKTQLEIKNRRTAVSIPSRLVKGEFADVIKEKVKQGINANPHYKLLLEKLVQPEYETEKEYIKEEMRRMLNMTSNADAQAYLTWLENNYGKIGHSAMSGKFEEEAIDLYIREEIEVQIQSWNVPNLPSHFIGREILLEHLAQRLNSKESQTSTVILTALHGLGGVGKTFLAARYAQLYAETYNFIFWFNAESETTLTNDYRNFASAFHLPIEEQSPENILTIIKNWLEKQSNWLIIYDNAPDDKLIAKYRPAKGGKILITSRKESWNKKESLAIDVFSLEEARAYIVELTGFSLAEYQTKIDKLAETLGKLPLALAQACAYISVNNLSLEDYLELYVESRAEMLADETMPAETNHEPVAITWHITFKSIEKQNPAASALLESCAFLQGNSIPEFLLKELFAKQQSELAKQKKPFIDVMRCLQQYSMLKLINKEEKIFSLHNLVQEVIFNTSSNKKKRIYLVDIVDTLQTVFPYKEVEQVEDYAKQRILLPHLEKNLQRVEELLSELKNDHAAEENLMIIEQKYLVCLLTLSAHGYSNLGDENKSKKLNTYLLNIEEYYYGKSHPEIVPTLVALAGSTIKLGDAQQAKSLLERALIIQEKEYGKVNPEIASILNNLANTVGELGNFELKKYYLERALIIQENSYGKDSLQVAYILKNLGNIIENLGDAQQGKEILERALKIEEQHFGKNHPSISCTLVNLAKVLGTLGDFQQQKKLLERALFIDEKHYGKDHPEVASTLNYLAIALTNLDEAEHAKQLLERALPILEYHYGKDHLQFAFALINLGNAYGSLGNNEKKKELLEYALKIEEKHYGNKSHPVLAITLMNLATALCNLGDYHKARIFLKGALKIQSQHFGKDHPSTALTLYNLAIVLLKMDKLIVAKETVERAYQIFCIHPDAGPQHPHTQIAKEKLDETNKLLATFSPEQLSALHAHGKTSVTEKNSPDLAKELRNAANQNNAEKLKELLPQIANVNTKDEGQHGRTALHWAVIKQAFPCIKLLLIAGADAMMVDNAGKSSMDYAAESPNPDALFVLLSHYYKLPLEDIDAGKLLRRAAHQNNVNDVKLLLKHIKNVDEKDTGNTQRTALHWAVIQRATDCIKLLMAAGANPQLVDGQGKTAYDYAQGKPELLLLLQSTMTQTYIS